MTRGSIMKHTKRAAILLITLLVGVLAFCEPASIAYAAAKVPAMRIHVPQTAKATSASRENTDAGDAVIVESKGKFLLMDTLSPDRYKDLRAYLKKRKITKFDIYISHLHKDHYGNLESLAKDYNVQTIYVPDKKIANEKSLNSWFYDSYLPKIKKNTKVKKIVYLQKGSKFKIGDAQFNIIGPVGKYKVATTKSTTGTSRSAKEDAYVNNNSLSAMVTCGKTKFFTAGDIEKAEENALRKKYGKKLRADIMKLNHHGIIGTSNQANFLGAVKPTHSFVQNGKVAEFSKSSRTEKVRRTSAARRNANKHGMFLSPDDEKKDLFYDISNNVIKVYRGSVAKKNLLSGWATIQGADGVYRKTDKFYIDPKTFKPWTGIKTINGKKYSFGTGGCMEYGRFDKNGTYMFVKYYTATGEDAAEGADRDFRYFNKDGSMRTGFVNITKPNPRRVYFDPKTGYAVRAVTKSKTKAPAYVMKNLKDNSDNIERWMVEIKGKRYIVSTNGSILRTSSGWRAVGKAANQDWRYLDKKTGEMKTGWLTDDKGNTYYLRSYTPGTIKPKDGLRLKGFHKIGGYVYFFRDGSGNYANTGQIVKLVPGSTGKLSGKDGYTVDENGWVSYNGVLLTAVPA